MMIEAVLFKPSKRNSAKQNLNNFIVYCREQLTLYEDQGGFSKNLWHYNHFGKRIPMLFVKYKEVEKNQNYEPLKMPFIDFAKAYIRYMQSLREVSSVGNKITALRTLHDALIEVHNKADVLKIDGIVQLTVVELLNNRFKSYELRYHVGGQLENLYSFLREKSIAPTLPVWKRPWKRKIEKASRTDKESRIWQDERCPSMHIMLAIADCFARAKTRQDQYWSSVIALLVFAPGRCGELKDLSVNSLYEENGRLGVIWYGEKGFDETIKWVPECMEETVKEAFRRLLEIGSPARKAAKFAYENPGKFYFHEQCITSSYVSDMKEINALEFAAAMGFSKNTLDIIKEMDLNSITAWNRVSFKTVKWIKQLHQQGKLTYQNLAKYINGKYQKTGWPFMPKTDCYIWESLLLIRDNEFHESQKLKPFSWVLPDINQVNYQLSPRNGIKKSPKTIFQRFNLNDEDGSVITLTSHQLRVWLSTNAERGGMDSWVLAKWAGRTHIQDNRHYDLRTQEEREAKVRAILQLEDRPTALQAIKMNLPVAYSDLGINRIGVADVTEYGMCVHDYAMSPCTKGGECISCKEHVCVKGMPKTLERILHLERLVTSQFEKAKIDADSNVYGADQWVTHLGWKLAHIRTQRVRLESDETPEGSILWISPEHDQSSVKRALSQQGYKIKTENTEKLK